jgi:NAD+ synthase (glutamine-hydrolysing)
MKDGFVKVAAASPMIRVADPDYNADRVIESINTARGKGVKVLVFPELTLTGCTCYDLFTHRTILEGAEKGLVKVVKATEGLDMLILVGLPFLDGARLYSCAAAVYSGRLLGLVPRAEVAGTHFAVPGDIFRQVTVGGEYETSLTADALFTSDCVPDLSVAVELGADMDAVTPPSVRHALAGATVIAQLASFPMTVTSRQDAELAAKYQSARLTAGFITASPNKGESTTDNVFSGLCMVTENGVILAEEEQQNSLAVTEVDVNMLANLRFRTGRFGADSNHLSARWGEKLDETELTRYFSKNPHLPAKAADVPAYCERLIDIQVSGLVKRMEYAGLDHCVVGISGGVDSTLCVMICARAIKRMGLPSTNVVACTMPCFGTTSRTKSNAIVVAEQIGAEVRVIDIGESVNKHFDDIGHARDDYSIAFENAQARERTQILMDVANEVNGLDVGTEDLSEFIDGWCTYNGDHTSMYDVNMGVTKTQVRAAVKHIAQNTDDKVLADALWDVLDCPVTPELLPVQNDTIEQKSEENVGSYSLQDFFTHKMLICGFTPAKTFRLAKIAYGDEFDDEELIKWLKSYCRRLFSQQFKRSCLMDGPAVEGFSVSPRNGFLIPSDGMDSLYIAEINELERSLGLRD